MKAVTIMDEVQERQVKGLWIPIEIWKDEHLTWNEKILFLEIDSFTTEENDCFFSNEYISRLLGINETNANKTLSSLIKKGYVIKTRFDGRRRYVKSALSYSTNQPCRERQAYIYSIDNSIDNDNDKELNKTLNKEEKNPKKRTTYDYPEDFEKAFIATGRKGSKINAFKRWKSLTDEDKAKAIKHIPYYYKSNDRQYLKDFEGYLNGRYFDNVVYDRKGNLVYDPERGKNSAYNPQTSYSLHWNDYYNCFMYIGFWDGYIPDGYKDDERPNGASVMLNNGRGTVVWNVSTKKWEKK